MSPSAAPRLSVRREKVILSFMAREIDIRIILAEEQTLLSRERTMHSYMQTGLAFTSVGLVIVKFLGGILAVVTGACFMALGGLLIMEAGRRYVRFRRAIRLLRRKEAELGYDVGTVI
jgi:uncharacterized membrane protein YidH (DUF202 family)